MKALSSRKLITGLAVAGLGAVAAVAIASQPGAQAPAASAAAQPQVQTEVVKRTKHVRPEAQKADATAVSPSGQATVVAAPALAPAAGYSESSGELAYEEDEDSDEYEESGEYEAEEGSHAEDDSSGHEGDQDDD